MAVIISRALSEQSTSSLNPEDTEEVLQRFNDSGEIAPWAQEGVAVVVSRGIVNGKSADAFAPALSASRAEAATIIYRICQQRR
jgi:hypothetical protein